MFIQVMHFSSVEVPFSSISKIFIHPENGGTGGAWRDRLGVGRGGAGRVEAGLTGPARTVRRSQTPPRPTSKFFHFVHLVCAAVPLSLAAPPCARLCASLHFRVCALESAPQRSAPILFHFFPPIFLSVLPLRPAQAAVLLRFCMRLCIRGHFLFASVLQCGDVHEGGVRS